VKSRHIEVRQPRMTTSRRLVGEERSAVTEATGQGSFAGRPRLHHVTSATGRSRQTMARRDTTGKGGCARRLGELH
jgi:hypothetical protein